jgi:hypothetical protein
VDHPQDNAFFASHVLKTGPAPSKVSRTAKAAAKKSPAVTAPTAAPAALTQGWVSRALTLTVQDGALTVSSAGGGKAGRGFITHPNLNLTGPLRATLRLRSRSGGALSLAWRTKEQPDFVPENTARTTVAASAEWQTVTFDVPAQGNVIHVRLIPPGDSSTEIAEISFRDTSAQPRRTWNFAQPAATP